jgi:hypothetical protein
MRMARSTGKAGESAADRGDGEFIIILGDQAEVWRDGSSSSCSMRRCQGQRRRATLVRPDGRSPPAGSPSGSWPGDTGDARVRRRVRRYGALCCAANNRPSERVCWVRRSSAGSAVRGPDRSVPGPRPLPEAARRRCVRDLHARPADGRFRDGGVAARTSTSSTRRCSSTAGTSGSRRATLPAAASPGGRRSTPSSFHGDALELA